VADKPVGRLRFIGEELDERARAATGRGHGEERGLIVQSERRAAERLALPGRVAREPALDSAELEGALESVSELRDRDASL
jgi:hypothetical protein